MSIDQSTKRTGRPRKYKTEEEKRDHLKEYNKNPELIKRKAENLKKWRNNNIEKNRAYGRKYYKQKKELIK